MCLVKTVENVAVRAGAGGKLGYERKEQVVTGLLVKIPEIEVKVGHDSRSSFADGHNILDNRGTRKKLSPDRKQEKNNEPDNAFPRARYKNRRSQKTRGKIVPTWTHVYRESTRESQ